MNKINWQNGTLVSPAKVEIGGVIYEVTPEQYSGNTPLSAENLNQMQDNIEIAIPEVVDNLISTDTSKALSANQGKELKGQIDDIGAYSTSEIIIGTYMDKPLYRKVVNIGSLPNNTAQTYNHYISNMDMLTYYDLIWYDTADNRFFKAPRIDNLEVLVKCAINTTNIQIEAKGVNWSNRTQNAKVVLEYTKTTD